MYSMESDKSIMPEVNIFPRLAKVGNFILDHLPTILPRETLASHGDHGASFMLDNALDTQPQLPFDDGGRWSDMGEYLGRE